MKPKIAIAHARGFLGEMLCTDAISRGYEVSGLVFGHASSNRNLPQVKYLSIGSEEGRQEAHVTLADVEILIHAGGPHTLDVSLLESDGTQAENLTDPRLKAGHPDFSTQIQSLYSRHASSILAIALRMVKLKLFVGVSSLSVSHKLDRKSSAVRQGEPFSLQEGPFDQVTSQFTKAPTPAHGSQCSAMTHPLGLSALAFERIVDGSKGWKSPNIRKLIVRLGTLIGHSKTGNYPNLNGIYSLAVFGHGLARGSGLLNSLPFLPMPFQERARLCLIPVDLAAQAMLDLAEKHYLDTPPIGQLANQTTSYRHITDPERDVSARRLFTAALRYSGLNAPPLAIGYNQYFEKLYQRMGLDTALIKLTPFNTPSSAQAFKADVPQFCLQPMLEYFPIMIGYAQKHLVYKSPIRGGQQ